jgi:hypothetical protein
MAHTDLQQPASPVSALAWGTLVIGGIFAVTITEFQVRGRARSDSFYSAPYTKQPAEHRMPHAF